MSFSMPSETLSPFAKVDSPPPSTFRLKLTAIAAPPGHRGSGGNSPYPTRLRAIIGSDSGVIMWSSVERAYTCAKGAVHGFRLSKIRSDRLRPGLYAAIVRLRLPTGAGGNTMAIDADGIKIAVAITAACRTPVANLGILGRGFVGGRAAV